MSTSIGRAERWLALLLQDGATLPTLTARAMGACVRRLPISADLAALDIALRQSGAHDPAELTIGEQSRDEVANDPEDA